MKQGHCIRTTIRIEDEETGRDALAPPAPRPVRWTRRRHLSTAQHLTVQWQIQWTLNLNRSSSDDEERTGRDSLEPPAPQSVGRDSLEPPTDSNDTAESSTRAIGKCPRNPITLSPSTSSLEVNVVNARFTSFHEHDVQITFRLGAKHEPRLIDRVVHPPTQKQSEMLMNIAWRDGGLQ